MKRPVCWTCSYFAVCLPSLSTMAYPLRIEVFCFLFWSLGFKNKINFLLIVGTWCLTALTLFPKGCHFILSSPLCVLIMAHML